MLSSSTGWSGKKKQKNTHMKKYRFVCKANAGWAGHILGKHSVGSPKHGPRRLAGQQNPFPCVRTSTLKDVFISPRQSNTEQKAESYSCLAEGSAYTESASKLNGKKKKKNCHPLESPTSRGSTFLTAMRRNSVCSGEHSVMEGPWTENGVIPDAINDNPHL